MPFLWNQPGVLWNSPQAVWSGGSAPPSTNKSKKVSAIVLNIKDLTALEIEAKLRVLAKAQTDNPTAATGLNTTSAMLTAAADAIKERLSDQATAEAAAAAATTNKDNAVDAGTELIRDYAPEVWKGTNKDAAKCTLLGFDVRDGTESPAPLPDGGQISGLKVTAGANPGDLEIGTDPMPRMHSMEVQVNRTPNAAPTWQHECISTSSSCMVHGQVSGSLVQIRVRAIFAGGVNGPWSDIAEHRVP